MAWFVHATVSIKQSHTSGCAFKIALRRDLCGSSVYVQKKWSSTRDSGGEIRAALSAVPLDSDCVLLVAAALRRAWAGSATSAMICKNVVESKK